MSRIGKKTIPVPAGVKVAVKDRTVNVEGPKGKLSFSYKPQVKVVFSEADKSVVCSVEETLKGDREANALWGTTRAIIRNMIEGTSKGYEKTMEVVGVGWTAALTGKKLKLVVGYSNPIELEVPVGLTVTVEKNLVKVAGADRQLVGQFAASMRQVRKPEPYNGKGIKYLEEVVRRKQGKQTGAA